MANNAASSLKQSLSDFRNQCQSTATSLLESVINYLIKKLNNILKQIDQQEGTEKIIKLLRSGDEDEDEGEGGVSAIQESTATPDELIMLANCDLDEIIERNLLLPRLTFYTEVSKIILDTLRQNSKLLEQYNQVA